MIKTRILGIQRHRFRSRIWDFGYRSVTTCNRIMTVGLIAYLCAGCSGIETETIAPYLPSDQLLVRLELSEEVYNMAVTPPYNVVQLEAKGFSGVGDTIDAVVEYSVKLLDQSKMSVSPTGSLTVTGLGSRMIVYARMTHNGATLMDSAFVNVVAEAPSRPVYHVGFELYSPEDSAKTSVGYIKYMKIVGEDDAGEDVNQLLVHVWSSDSSVGSISNSRRGLFTGAETSVQGRMPGQIVVYISTFAFGVSFKDSLVYRVGWPISQPWVKTSTRFDIKSSSWFIDFDQKYMIIGTGGCVRWSNNNSDLPVDVEFDDPSAAAPPSVPAWTIATGGRISNALFVCEMVAGHDDNGGNIAPFTPQFDSTGKEVLNSSFRARTFPRPGIYKYRSKLNGTEGTIIVCDESFDDPVCDPGSYSWLRL